MVATVAADAFCQAMVRSLVGALLPVGDGRRPADWPGSLLARRERANEVVVAPPHGLTLVEVGYPTTRPSTPRRAELTRNRRACTRLFADAAVAGRGRPCRSTSRRITWSRRYFSTMS